MNDHTHELTDVLNGLEGVRMDLETVESALDRLSFDLEEGRDILKEDGETALVSSPWFHEVLPGDAAIFALAVSSVSGLIDQVEKNCTRIQSLIAQAERKPDLPRS